MQYLRHGVICLFSCMSILALRGEDGTSPFSFVDPTVRILAGAQDGTTEITLRSSTAQKAPPDLKDFDFPHPPTATVTFELANGDNSQPGLWRFRARVSGLSRSNTSEQHYAVITYGDPKATQTIPYLVTNAAPNFSWVVSKIPEPWVESSWLPAPACDEFTVTPKDYPATDVSLGSSTLVEQNAKIGISIGKLRLCLPDGDHCASQQTINLPPNVPTRLQLCTTEGFHGNFHGAITLTSAQKPDGDVILQSASFSTFFAKGVGVLLLCGGVYLAWWSKVWARARLERDQALIPALLLRVQLDALQQVLDGLPSAYRSASSNLNVAITGLLNELSDSVLDGKQFLPPKFPSPYGYSIDAAGYKAYVEARNPQVQLFAVLVKQGVVPANNEDNGTLTGAQQALVVTAIQNIAAICAVPQPTAGQALQLIQPILLGLHDALFPPAPAAAPLGPAASSVPPATELQTLQLQVESISKGVWLLYGVLTAVSGLAVLIINNQGFGIPLDFIFSFFWGFGLPTTIGALAPGSTASALNISVAKS